MSIGERHAETKNENHSLARLLRNAQREADACAGYVLEAEVADDKRLAGFFQDVQALNESVAEQAERIGELEGRSDRE